MYNSYRRGTEAHNAMQEFVDADKSMDTSLEELRCAAENACSAIDDQNDQIEEVEGERDELETLLDKKETIAATRYIAVLEKIRVVIDDGIKQVRAEFNVAETVTDGSAGDRSDDSAEGNNNEGSGSEAT